MTARATHPDYGAALLLADELLESVLDTIQLMVEPRLGVRWQAHLEYLRALHRRGRAMLASESDGTGGPSPRFSPSTQEARR